MICGALQTLNEEACEDVLDVPVSPAVVTQDSLPPGEPSTIAHTIPLVVVQEPPKSDQSPDSVNEFDTNL